MRHLVEVVVRVEGMTSQDHQDGPARQVLLLGPYARRDVQCRPLGFQQVSAATGVALPVDQNRAAHSEQRLVTDTVPMPTTQGTFLALHGEDPCHSEGQFPGLYRREDTSVVGHADNR